MEGQRIGYVQVSSFDQNPARQLENIHVDKIFTDKASGKDVHRPELEAMLSFVREGDGDCARLLTNDIIYYNASILSDLLTHAAVIPLG